MNGQEDLGLVEEGTSLNLGSDVGELVAVTSGAVVMAILHHRGIQEG